VRRAATPGLDARPGRYPGTIAGDVSGGMRHEVKAEFFGLALQVLDGPFASLTLIIACAGVAILGAVLEHRVDNTGELVGGGSDAPGLAQPGAHVATVAAQGAVAMQQALRRHTERGSRAVLALERVAADDLASRLVVVGTHAQPRGKVLDGRPGTHIHADFAEHLVGDEDVDAVNLGQVHPRHLVEIQPEVERRRIAPRFALWALGGRQGLSGEINLGRERRVAFFDFGVAGLELLLEKVMRFQRLPQGKDVLGLVVAFERLGDLVLALGAVGIAVRRQLVRVALAGDDVAQDEPPGHARDVADHVGQLEIHLLQRLLHVLNLAGAALDQIVAMPGEGAQRADIFGGTKGGLEQAVGVQLLNPLAVQNVGLATGHLLEMPRVDQVDAKVSGFEQVIDRNPIDARGFHGDGLHATGGEPVSQRVQVARKGGKDAHGRVGAPFGDGGVDFVVADVESRCVEVDLLQRIERGDATLYSGGLALGTLFHFGLLWSRIEFRPDAALAL